MSLRLSIELLRQWSYLDEGDRPTPEQVVRWATHEGAEGRPDQDPIVQDYLFSLLSTAHRGEAWLRRYAIKANRSMPIAKRLEAIRGAFWSLSDWRRACRLPIAGGEEGVRYQGMLWNPTISITTLREDSSARSDLYVPRIVHEWDVQSMGQTAIDMACSTDSHLRALGRKLLETTCLSCHGTFYDASGEICGRCDGEGSVLQLWMD